VDAWRSKGFKMRETYITRKDSGLGVGLFDSIEWAFEHFDQKDNKEYNFGVAIGWHDSEPKKVLLWKEEPNYDTKPDLVLEETK